jgi:3-hydroxymyristoyl/3-hydroxydecanoyl-(acyl carrier protein) dehydratase
MTVATHRVPLLVGADHPALDGHFPGQPVVPGVVLLDCALEAAEDWLGRALDVATLAQAKFLAPLEPGVPATLALEHDGRSLKFRVERDAELLAHGVFQLDGGA